LQDPISKITRAKWTGVVARVIEHLLFKREAKDKTKQKNTTNSVCMAINVVTKVCFPSCVKGIPKNCKRKKVGRKMGKMLISTVHRKGNMCGPSVGSGGSEYKNEPGPPLSMRAL
jgi:hypothetical protein